MPIQMLIHQMWPPVQKRDLHTAQRQCCCRLDAKYPATNNHC